MRGEARFEPTGSHRGASGLLASLEKGCYQPATFI